MKNFDIIVLGGGRCISTDREAQASIRIMPICTTTGEAVGVGAVRIASLTKF